MWWVLISANTYVSTIWSKYRILSLPLKSHYVWSSQSRSIIVLRKYFSDFCNYNFSFPWNLYTWNNIMCQFHSSSSHNFCYGEEWHQSSACPASGSYSPGSNVPLPWLSQGQVPGTRGGIPVPWSLLKLFKQLNLKLTNPTYSASPIPSHENQDKGFCPYFPLSCFSCEQQFLPSWQSVLCVYYHTRLKQIPDVF